MEDIMELGMEAVGGGAGNFDKVRAVIFLLPTRVPRGLRLAVFSFSHVDLYLYPSSH